ncbi:MAG: hypothetical protein HOP09_02550 [Hyphomicrobium sp.]|nr:hypothetical protein [Hyphomicrobium sp.]
MTSTLITGTGGAWRLTGATIASTFAGGAAAPAAAAGSAQAGYTAHIRAATPTHKRNPHPIFKTRTPRNPYSEPQHPDDITLSQPRIPPAALLVNARNPCLNSLIR